MQNKVFLYVTLVTRAWLTACIGNMTMSIILLFRKKGPHIPCKCLLVSVNIKSIYKSFHCFFLVFKTWILLFKGNEDSLKCFECGKLSNNGCLTVRILRHTPTCKYAQASIQPSTAVSIYLRAIDSRGRDHEQIQVLT